MDRADHTDIGHQIRSLCLRVQADPQQMLLTHARHFVNAVQGIPGPAPQQQCRRHRMPEPCGCDVHGALSGGGEESAANAACTRHLNLWRKKGQGR